MPDQPAVKSAANPLPPVGNVEWEECGACGGWEDNCWACQGGGGQDVRLVDCSWCGGEAEWPGVVMYDGTRACTDCADNNDNNDDYRAGGAYDVR